MTEVLIITFHMVPNSDSWGGTQRVFYMAEFLKKMDINVEVISVDQNQNNFFGKQIDFLNIPLKPNKNYSKQNLLNNKLYKIVNRLKNIFFNDLSYIDAAIVNSWIKTNKWKISELILNKNFNYVLISCPPFKMFKLSRHIKANCRGVRLIADYRDPWHVWHKGNFISRYFEKKYLSLFDDVIFTNQNCLNAYKDFFNLKNNLYVIQNGYSEEDWKNIEFKKETNKVFTINYVGSISITKKINYRNTQNFLEAIKNIKIKGYEISVNFYGVMHLDAELEKKYSSDLGDSVVFHKNISYTEAYVKMLSADLLLLIHTAADDSGRYIINGKFYDYVRSKRPIFYVGSKNDIHWKLIEENKLGYNTIDDQYAIEETLIGIISQRKTFNYEMKFDINKLSRDFQNRRLFDIIKNHEK